MLLAITRPLSPSIAECELTHLERIPIDLASARQQHHQYEQALMELGCQMIRLAEEPNLPDSVFVEDTAVVLEECAVITRPGADSRRSETESIAQALAPYRKLFTIQAPGTVDGGDVLAVNKTIYIGLTTRSNQSAVDQMRSFLAPFGYEVMGVAVAGCLHLKSAVTQVAADTLLINPAWVEKKYFKDLKFIEVDPSEPNAANALMVAGKVIVQPAHPKTRQRLEVAGLVLVLVDASELAKAEGALTCCSLIFSG